MKKETNCPECGYPMEPELKTKPYKAKVEYMNCPSCKHRERTPSVTESMKLENELKKLQND